MPKGLRYSPPFVPEKRITAFDEKTPNKTSSIQKVAGKKEILSVERGSS
jgi:hypothetical protein